MYHSSLLSSKVSDKNQPKTQFWIIISLLFLGLGLVFQSSQTIRAEQDAEQITMYFVTQDGCPTCVLKESDVDDFLLNHTDINGIYIWVDYGDPEDVDNLVQFKEEHEIDLAITTPFVVFERNVCQIVLQKSEIDLENLEAVYQRIISTDPSEECPEDTPSTPNTTPWVSFSTGFLTGLSPCLILVTTFISTVLANQNLSGKKKDSEKINSESKDSVIISEAEIMKEEIDVDTLPVLNKSATKKNHKKNIKLFSIYIGFILGVVLMYVLLGIASVGILSQLSEIIFGDVAKIIFSVILGLLGLWFIIDAFNENSVLFKTPKKIKKLISKLANRGQFLYSFVLGFIFSTIKIPCAAGGMFALITVLVEHQLPILPNLTLFMVGSLTPMIVLMVLLGIGVQAEKVDELRVKYRPYIRLISGFMMIGLILWVYFP